MATYRKGDETVVTVNGSYHDRRLAASKDWQRVDDTGTHEPVPEPPARNASRDEWVGWATDPRGGGLADAEAAALTRDEIIATTLGTTG